MPESSDEPIRRENFRKPGRQECADWEAQLNQTILATDIREGKRGTGLAAALFHHVLEVASREVDQVDLYVAVENERAWRFYQRFGFESYGVMPRALRVAGADYDALMMTRKFR